MTLTFVVKEIFSISLWLFISLRNSFNSQINRTLLVKLSHIVRRIEMNRFLKLRQSYRFPTSITYHPKIRRIQLAMSVQIFTVILCKIEFCQKITVRYFSQ